MLGGLPGGDLVPPDVAALGPRGVLAGAADDEDVLDVLETRDGVVDGGLERGRLAAAVAAVGRDDDLGVRVLDTGGDGVGREAAEDHGVRCADAGAGQHRDGGLGDHRQVDGDPVALADAQLGQRVGGPGDLVLQLRVGDGPAVARLTLEVDGDPVAVARLDVAVHAVVRDVQLAVREPLREGRVAPVEGLGRLGGPRQAAGLLGPEAQPVRLGLLVRLCGDVGVGGQLGRRSEFPLFPKQVGQALVAHDFSQSQGVRCVPGHSSSGAGPGDKGLPGIGLDLCLRVWSHDPAPRSRVAVRRVAHGGSVPAGWCRDASGCGGVRCRAGSPDCTGPGLARFRPEAFGLVGNSYQ